MSGVSGTFVASQVQVAPSVVAASGLATDAVEADKIKAGAVTAGKLGAVTDGTSLDQNGAGGVLQVKNGGITAAKLAAGVGGSIMFAECIPANMPTTGNSIEYTFAAGTLASGDTVVIEAECRTVAADGGMNINAILYDGADKSFNLCGVAAPNGHAYGHVLFKAANQQGMVFVGLNAGYAAWNQQAATTAVTMANVTKIKIQNGGSGSGGVILWFNIYVVKA